MIQWFLSATVRQAIAMRKHVQKILNHQRDILSAQAIQAVQTANQELDQAVTANADKPALEQQMENLEKVIESLRRAGDYTNDIHPEQIARLKSAIEYMRKVEFDLARDLDRLNQKDKYFFAEDNEAPGSYQKLVEEYYKSLARSK